jgi:hypothetical protein
MGSKIKKREPVEHFRAHYKAPRSGKLTTISIFAENTSEAIKLAPKSIDMGKKLFYGLS